MRNYSDPTANQAVGTITKEWNMLSRIAKKIRENPDSEWARREIRRFTPRDKWYRSSPKGNH